MSIEHAYIVPRARIPEDIYEQVANLPGKEERERISVAIFEGISSLLKLHGVKIDWEHSKHRPVKSIARINDKIVRRNSSAPAADIYGARFITEDPRRIWLANLIQSAYPETPKYFISGKPTFRDYSDEKVRANHIEKMNPHMNPEYSALHINFFFRREGNSLYDIGEIQIMTHKELEIYEATRASYPNGDGPKG